MRKVSALAVLLFWLVIAVSPSFPGTVPDCCKGTRTGYCPMRSKMAKPEEEPKPSCHDEKRTDDCVMKSVCTHQVKPIVFWFDAIVPENDFRGPLAWIPSLSWSQANLRPEPIEVNTPPPKIRLS
jgi:hypothetical protein